MRACVAASARSSLFTLGSVVSSGSATGVPRSNGRERGDDGGRGSGSVELPPGHALDDPDVEALAHDPGVDALAVDRIGDLGELVADGRVVGLDRRRDVDAEEPRPSGA